MDTTEAIVAGILLAALVAITSQGASAISDALDQVAPNGVPYATCVEGALAEHGITATQEMQAQLENRATPATPAIQACVATKVPDWLAEALAELDNPQ
mgnify:CR=1 FL=1